MLPFDRHRVVSDTGESVVPGEEGELWIGGGGLARGYVGKPGHTAERFIPDPWSERGDVVYRTGDIVRERPDGQLVFLGRRDRQVKISGVRVEPAEIETAIRMLPGVESAVAVVVARRLGKSLVLYVVPAGADPDEPVEDPEGLSVRIRASLPHQLSHTKIRFVASLPLNASGKVDHAALLATRQASSRPDSRRESASPAGA